MIKKIFKTMKNLANAVVERESIVIFNQIQQTALLKILSNLKISKIRALLS